ncbi:MAG: four helix bundle suffix domain-containing protein [candidate division NC10 bacterium]
MAEGFIPAHGGYQKLMSYQKAEIVYDATVFFCNRFIDRRSRTHDQMVQAARSGKQNIVEGSMASGTSKEMEIKLTNVARASLEELLEDYRDFLRVRKLPIWDKNDPRAQVIRRLGRESHGSHKSYGTYESYATYVEQGEPEIAANAIICLVHQANYLLDQQIRSLEQAFLKEGGLRERMTRARLEERKKIRP